MSCVSECFEVHGDSRPKLSLQFQSRCPGPGGHRLGADRAGIPGRPWAETANRLHVGQVPARSLTACVPLAGPFPGPGPPSPHPYVDPVRGANFIPSTLQVALGPGPRRVRSREGLSSPGSEGRPGDSGVKSRVGHRVVTSGHVPAMEVRVRDCPTPGSEGGEQGHAGQRPAQDQTHRSTGCCFPAIPCAGHSRPEPSAGTGRPRLSHIWNTTAVAS